MITVRPQIYRASKASGSTIWELLWSMVGNSVYVWIQATWMLQEDEPYWIAPSWVRHLLWELEDQ